MIRNFLFSIFFYIGIILICIIFLPAFFLPQKIVLFGGKIMGHWSRFCLEFFLSTKIVIRGSENLIKNEKFFIACSHQSMFETFYLQTIFNSPVFILKKELLSIPIFGWYLKKIKMSLKSTDRPIIIFPQATRVAANDRSPFKKGASRIYETLNIKCQPVAINSGNGWPKSGLLIANKTLTISILKSIEPGLDSKQFLDILQNSIYKELDNIS